MLRAVRGTKVTNEYHFVMCNQHKCKTLYPHADIKHSGPCLYCWRKLVKKALKRKGNLLYLGGENEKQDCK